MNCFKAISIMKCYKMCVQCLNVSSFKKIKQNVCTGYSVAVQLSTDVLTIGIKWS